MSPSCDSVFCAPQKITDLLSIVSQIHHVKLPALGGRGTCSCLYNKYLGLLAAP